MKKRLPQAIALLVVIALLVGAAIFIWQFIQNRETPEPPTQNPDEQKEEQREVKRDILLETIEEVVNIRSPGTSFSVGIYDLNRDEYFGINDEKPQHAASLSKVLTAIYVYDQAEKGKVDLGDPMGAYNIEAQINFLINVSSQDSWELLDERFLPKKQNAYAKEIGLKNTNLSLGTNKMSAKDVTILLKKLEKGELIDNTNKGKLYSYMMNTESEDFFSPAFKKEDLAFYHKTGKYIGEGHDAAIVLHKDNPFVLVMLSNNNTSTNLISRGPVMAEVATAVLDYFDEI